MHRAGRLSEWTASPSALAMVVAFALPTAAWAGGIQTLSPVDVNATATNLVGTADSSTEGTITPQQLEDRPLLRPGELLEGVPGLSITQHSGEGKANQYYLRGINLDHGTDFSLTVDGMPVNMPTHAHGQGYNDINFIIPELISGIKYRKGPYSVEDGDFSAIGSAYIDYVKEIPRSFALVTVGSDGYERGVAGTSFNVYGGKLLLGAEVVHDNGPWTHPDNFYKANFLARYTTVFGKNSLTIDAMAYYGQWNATNQTANRAVDEGLVPYFGNLDPTDKGSTYRYSLSAQYRRLGRASVTDASVYVIAYGLDLYNDFTYFLENPGTGDQFHQKDRRIILGAKASQTWFNRFWKRDMDNTIGIQTRNDFIYPVELDTTDATNYELTKARDNVIQSDLSLYAQNRFQWTKKLRTVIGFRFEYYHWNVDSTIPASQANAASVNQMNSAKVNAVMPLPKLSIILGPWAKTEFFINGGFGFHSNDIRSVTEKVQSQFNLPQTPVSDALERAEGAEVGLRTAIIPHLQNELTVWYLHMANEQIFDGDSGTTSPAYPSHRYGVESANYYKPLKWLTVDADLAYSVARFIGDPDGYHIPESPTWVVQGGVAIDDIHGFIASVRADYFGTRPLIDNGAVTTGSSTVVNARVGYKFHFNHVKDWRLWLDVFNVLNNKTQDVEYYYISRLPGEPPSGVYDGHTHPVDDIQVRATLKAVF